MHAGFLFNRIPREKRAFRIERISSSAVNHSGKWSVPEVLSRFRAERTESQYRELLRKMECP